MRDKSSIPGKLDGATEEVGAVIAAVVVCVVMVTVGWAALTGGIGAILSAVFG